MRTKPIVPASLAASKWLANLIARMALEGYAVQVLADGRYAAVGPHLSVICANAFDLAGLADVVSTKPMGAL